MAFIDNVLEAAEITANAKQQAFDRTIQAIVKDNSDPDHEGLIKISYKDAILSVYTEAKNVKEYKPGAHVYVTIPNNDINERKTILGLVEKIGPLAIINDNDEWSIENRYQAAEDVQFMDDDFTIGTKFFKYEYVINSGNNESSFKRYDSSRPGGVTENNAKIQEFLKYFKDAAVQGNYLRLKGIFTTFLMPEQRNFSSFNYGIKISFKVGGEYFSTTLDIDQMTGNPYFQKEQQQSIIIDTTKVDAKRLQSITIEYERYGFPPSQQNLEENNVVNAINPFISISNFIVEVVSSMSQEETADLTLYINPLNGKTFLAQGNGTSITALKLNAVIKENKVQLDNSSLKCWWYERDSSWIDAKTNLSSTDDSDNIIYDYYNQLKAIAILDKGGPGWRPVHRDMLTAEKVSNVVGKDVTKEFSKIKNSYPSQVYDYNINDINPFTVYREDLGLAINKEYKVVGIYNGVELSATIIINDRDKENPYSLTLEEKTLSGETYTQYRLKTTTNKNANISLKWFYLQDGEASELLIDTKRIDEENDKIEGCCSSDYWTIGLKHKIFPYSGEVICEIYESNELVTTLRENYNTPLGEQVLFYNFEQVFLYDSNGKIKIVGDNADEGEEEDKYSVTVRPLSLSGVVSNVNWYIPDNHFFDTSQLETTAENTSTIDFIEQDGIRYIKIRDRTSLSNLKIKKDFSKDAFCENITVTYHFNSADYSKSTNFSFLMEGDDGTNGSGLVCRVVPNIDTDSYCPNTVILGVQNVDGDGGTRKDTKTMFNFLPARISEADMNRGIKKMMESRTPRYFKAQLWKQNKKIFEGTIRKASDRDITKFRWELLNDNIIQCNNSSDSIIGCQKAFSEEELLEALRLPQGIKAIIKYQGQEISYTLPFLTFGFTEQDRGANNHALTYAGLKKYSIINNKNSFSLNQLVKFYYNEDGEVNGISVNDSNNVLSSNLKKSYAMIKPDSKDETECQAFLLKGDEYWWITKGTSAIKEECQTTYKEVDLTSHFGILASGENSYKINPFATRYYPGKTSSDVIWIIDNKNKVYIQIPLLSFLILVSDSFIADWDGGVEINEEEGDILTEWIAAGEVSADNSFSGGVLGKRNNKNGLVLYNGERTMYLSKEGTIELGTDPEQRLKIKGSDQTITSSVEGMKLDFGNKSLSFNYIGSTVEENSENTVQAIQLNKNKQSLFSLSENGYLHINRIFGENSNQKKDWCYYNLDYEKGDDPNDVVNRGFQETDTLFIDKKGIIGTQFLTIGKQSKWSNEVTFGGISISPFYIRHNLKISNNTIVYPRVAGSEWTSGGFSLTKDGIIASKGSESNYTFCSGSGWMSVSGGFCVGGGIDISSSTGPSKKEQKWRLTNEGLLSPQGLQKIYQDPNDSSKRSFSLSGNGVSISSQVSSETKKIKIIGAGSTNTGAAKAPYNAILYGDGALHVESGNGIFARGITSDGEICSAGSIRAGCSISSAFGFSITTDNATHWDGIDELIQVVDPSTGDTLLKLNIKGGIIVGAWWTTDDSGGYAWHGDIE